MSENPESLRIAGAAYFDEFTKTHDLLSALEAQARRIAELTGNREAWKGIQEGTARLLKEKEARIAELEAENAKLRTVLRPFLGKNASLFRILFDSYDDDATATVTVKLGDIRAVHTALEKKDE